MRSSLSGGKWEEFCVLLASWVAYQGVARDATGWQTFSRGTMLLPNIPVPARAMSARELAMVFLQTPLVDLEASHCAFYSELTC